MSSEHCRNEKPFDDNDLQDFWDLHGFSWNVAVERVKGTSLGTQPTD